MPLPADFALTGRWCDRGESHDDLDYSELPSDGLESGDRFVDIVARMRRATLAANSCLPMRNNGKPESRNKDAFLQQHVTHLDGGSRLPYDYGDDGGLSGQRLEARFGYLLAEVVRVIPERLNAFRVRLEELNRCKCARGNSRRQRV